MKAFMSLCCLAYSRKIKEIVLKNKEYIDEVNRMNIYKVTESTTTRE